MSDRIAVMFDGEIDQMDDPEELYRRPKSRRVAGFIGMMNFLPATLGQHVSQMKTPDPGAQNLPAAAHTRGFLQRLRDFGKATPEPPKALPEYETGIEIEVAGLGRCIIPPAQVPARMGPGNHMVGIRPETLAIVFDGDREPRHTVDGVVDEVVYYGDMTYYDVRVDGVDKPLTISMKNLIGRPVLEVGTRTKVAWDERSLVLLGI